MNFNNVTLVGRVTRDIEEREVGEHKVYNFGLAVNRKINKDKEEVLFIDCEAWNKTGELINEHSGKGAELLVNGHLKMDSWEKDGEKKTKIKVVVNSFQFGRGKGDDNGAPAPKSNGKPSNGSKKTSRPPVEEDDIPF